MAIAAPSPRRSLSRSTAQPGRGSALDEAILSTATAVFARHGYRNTDVQVVADELNVGKGSVYRRFPTKQALFLAAVDRGMHLLHETVETAISALNDPLAQVAGAIRAYLDFFAKHPDLVELLIQERAEFRDRATPTYFRHREANLGRWRQLYTGLIADGRVRRVPVDRITDVMSGLVYGTMFINFFAGQKKTSAAQANDILDVVFRGILSPGERAARRRKDRRR